MPLTGVQITVDINLFGAMTTCLYGRERLASIHQTWWDWQAFPTQRYQHYLQYAGRCEEKPFRSSILV